MNHNVGREVRILDGSSFFVSDSLGDVHEHLAQGLFFKDTRFLSSNLLRINGERPALLSTKTVDYFSARFFMTLPFDSAFDGHPLSIIRSRLIGRGATEQVLLQNNSEDELRLMVALSFDADFADIFAVKGGKTREKKRTITHKSDEKTLAFSYADGNFSRETVVRFSRSAAIIDKTAYFDITLKPRAHWTLDISIIPVVDAKQNHPKYSMDSFGEARPEMDMSMKHWLDRFPVLHTDMDHLKHAFNQTAIDLAALRFHPVEGGESVIAAGLPWFMALFGRDNLITSYQACFIAPRLAKASLTSLARLQGTKSVDFTDEDPGKILHELRFDELTTRGKLPYRPYYGSADSTPLFLILLNEYFRWTADKEFVKSLEDSARAALKWIDTFGDSDGDGYVEYKTRSSKGLKNQCWKDSWDSIAYANGRLAEPPLALCEIQGYVYDAKMRTAELCEWVWDDDKLARRLREEAAALRKAFNRDYWNDRHGGFFVLALDKEKRQVDSRTSNMGQLLWTGIVEEAKAKVVVAQLFSDELFSGWGIRTMAQSDKGYNPLGYHTGTVWPHDNSIIAAGLARYGYRDEANRIVEGLVQASEHFAYRLPEVFAGFPRKSIDYPVEYPTACSPQAWSTGAIAFMLRTVLGINSDPFEKTIEIDAHLPKTIGYLKMSNLQLFDNVFEIEVDHDHSNLKSHAPKSPIEELRSQQNRAAS